MFLCSCNFSGIWLQCSHREVSSQAELLCVVVRKQDKPNYPSAWDPCRNRELLRWDTSGSLQQEVQCFFFA